MRLSLQETINFKKNLSQYFSGDRVWRPNLFMDGNTKSIGPSFRNLESLKI